MAATKNIDEIASVYAQSLLEVCDKAGGNAVAEACASELRDLAEIIRGDRKFAEFLRTPIVGNDRRKAALEKIVRGRVSDLVFRFVMVLANHGRAGRIADVADAFDALLQERLGRIEVDIPLHPRSRQSRRGHAGVERDDQQSRRALRRS
jgi:F0F1-type ATP synthase delta subunit